MKHKTIKILLGLFVVLIAVIAVAFASIDRLARVAVEAGATYALGVRTTLSSISLGVLSGQVRMNDLNVTNPEGFDADHFLRLGEGRIGVSLGSLMSDRVEVPELSLNGIDMSLERKQGRSNYKVILDGLKKFESGESAAPTKSEGGKKFVIRKVVVSDVTVDVNLLAVGGELTRVPVKIERIELTDIGSDSAGGAQMAEISSIITKAILTAVVNKAGSVLPGDIAGELKSGLGDLTKLSGDTLKVVGEVTAVLDGEVKKIGELGFDLTKGIDAVGKEVIKDVKGVGEKVDEGLKGLLGKKKEKEKKDEK